MLKVTDLKKEYKNLLFDNISFQLGNKEKVGLVGLNGSGKSTLLKIIAGIEEADSGNVTLGEERIGYLPQEFNLPNDMLAGEYCEDLLHRHQLENYKLDKAMGILNLEFDEYQEISTLSEGQKMKLFLLELVLTDATVLLLDEPTNHLDINGIIWFENFISRFDGICIIISHDRAFLNNTINKVFEIDEHKLKTYEGNYDDFLDQKGKHIELREMHFKAQERKRKKLETLIKNVSKIGDGKKRSRAINAAKKRMDREVTRNEIDLYKEARVADFDVKGQIHESKIALRVRDLTFGYSEEKLLLSKVNFELRGNQRIWFYGGNGIGKTTLIKLLLNQLTPTSGEVQWGDGLRWAYFSQDQKHLNMDQTVEDFFLKNTGVHYYQSFGLLEKFLFPRELRSVKLGQLSPGQRARISFAVFAQNEFDFLVLDEPTNHLDIGTKEVIENALTEYSGGIILISHDRYFVNNIDMQRSITLENGELVEDNIFNII